MRFPLVALALTTGCGYRVLDGLGFDAAQEPRADAASAVDTSGPTTVVDSAQPDTRTSVPDTRPPDMGPISCATTLDATFTCMPPAAKAGSTECTEAMLQEFRYCFGADGDSTKCSAAMKAYPKCNSCVLDQWLYESRYVDTGACIRVVSPASSCGTTWRCNIDCLTAVCGECDDTPGSGKTASTSEKNDCERDAQSAGTATKPRGACYDVASKGLAECTSDPTLAPCFVRTSDDVVAFYRGACRDGGSWARAYEP
jgi:hypothetical protein